MMIIISRRGTDDDTHNISDDSRNKCYKESTLPNLMV